MLSDPLIVVAAIARVFDEIGIRYMVTGSLASSVYGIPRATQDVDLVAEMAPAEAEAVAIALGAEFYMDAVMMREAVRDHGSFNMLHLATLFKADVFIMQDDVWSREAMARARVEEIEVPGGRVELRIASAEDTLLHKLVWYKLGHEASDRQWGDILGILKIQAAALDREYIEKWAPALDVQELFLRARQQS